MKREYFTGEGTDNYDIRIMVYSNTLYPIWQVKCDITLYIRYNGNNFPHKADIDYYASVKAYEFEDKISHTFASNSWEEITTFSSSLWYDDSGNFSDMLLVTAFPSDASNMMTVKENVTLDRPPKGSMLISCTCDSKYISGTFDCQWASPVYGSWNCLYLHVFSNCSDIHAYNQGVDIYCLLGTCTDENATETNKIILNDKELKAIADIAQEDSADLYCECRVLAFKSDHSDMLGVNYQMQNCSDKLPNDESDTITLSLEIEEKYKPNLKTVNITPVNGSNGYVLSGYSSVKFELDADIAETSYKSPIVRYVIQGEGINYSGSGKTYTSPILTKTGKYAYTVTAYDQRGRSDTKTVIVEVVAYDRPSGSLKAYRCDEDGTRNDVSGTYIHVDTTYLISKYTSLEFLSLSIGNNVVSTEFEATYANNFGNYDINTPYEVVLTIKDSFGETLTLRTEVKVTFMPIMIAETKDAIGIGGVTPGPSKTARFGWEVQLQNGLKEFVNLVDLIYPVGSQIYNANKEFNPNKYYPNTTWVRIKGYVLAGINEDDTDTTANTTFNKEAGEKIGSKWLHKHSHQLNGHAFNWGSTGWANEVYAQNAIAVAGNPPSNNLMTSQGYWNRSKDSGSGDGQNIQPTQLTYIWERTK